MKSAELDKMLGSGKISPLLLLHGEETFLLEKALLRLLNVTVPEARDFNYQLIRGREVRAAVIIDAARTLPVFSSYRLILIKETEEIPAAELDAFIPYLRDPCLETVLVFTAEKIDGRRKFFQEFRKHGQLFEFRRLYENQIPAFVEEQARSAGFFFTGDALAQFCRRVGNNLQEVHGELMKLFSFLGDRTLADVADVAAVVSDTRIDSIFDLTNAIGQKKTVEALLLLERMLGEGMAPLLILSMLVRHFRQLWMARELLDQKTAPREIAKQLGINPYFLEGLLHQARRFSTTGYRQAFELFLEVDQALKATGAHPAARLECLILALGEGNLGGPAGNEKGASAPSP